MRKWIDLLNEWTSDYPSDEPFVMPEIWYHSTELDPVKVAADFARNNADPTGAAPSDQFWFSDSWEASRYYGENTVSAKLHFTNPLIVTNEMWKDNKSTLHGPTKWAAKAKAEGYDACVILDIMDGDMFSNVCCVFSADIIEARPYARYNEETDSFDLL